MALQYAPRVHVKASSDAHQSAPCSFPKPSCRWNCGEIVRIGCLSQFRGISLPPVQRAVMRKAKFQEFDGSKEAKGELEGNVDGEQVEVEDVPDFEDIRDDSVLPNDLEDAVVQSAEAAALYIASGGTRAIVELLLPELENLDEDGAQEKLWNLSRLFLETVQEASGLQRVKAVFPDAGAAALVKSRWGDVSFSFGSLNDRRPISKEDELVVLVAPDYQMLADVQRIASSIADDTDAPARPFIMWNPSLVSGDVGIGLNVRRMRESFLSTFTTVYSMRPFQIGAMFRKYPGLWQVFLDDKESPGRYVLAKEFVRRPNLDDLDVLFLTGGAETGKDEEPSPLVKVMGLMASFNRFMKSLSN